MRDADLPQDAQWADIDAMDVSLDFTLSADRYCIVVNCSFCPKIVCVLCKQKTLAFVFCQRHCQNGASCPFVLTSAGRFPMPPYWSLGYHQCKFGYFDLEDMKAVRNRMNDYDIPLDAMWGDIEVMKDILSFTIDDLRSVFNTKTLSTLLPLQKKYASLGKRNGGCLFKTKIFHCLSHALPCPGLEASPSTSTRSRRKG